MPIGSAQPAKPGSGMPNLPGFSQMEENQQPKALTGSAGQVIDGIDIMMFKMPVPGEQRDKLQGTLGFGEEKAEEMDKVVPWTK